MSMTATNEAPEKGQGSQLAAVKPLQVQLKEKQGNFAAALPAHIPAERFARVILTAIQNNPDLAKADRASLWNSCMRAAQDGLLPDGRDGALVIYNTKVGGDWIAKVQWMPMVGGIRKKVRNSSTISTWDVHAVHAKDHFEFELGDDPFIKHKPYRPTQLEPKPNEKTDEFAARLRAHRDPGPLTDVYSVAVLKSGERSRDVMSRSDVEYVRDTYSKKNRDGNFSPAWVKSFDEMAKKTVARRHSKVLPMSSDLDDLLRRDDALYDLDGKSDRNEKRLAGPKTIADRIDALVSGSALEEEAGDGGAGEIELSAGERIDSETGEITQAKPAGDGAAKKPDEQAVPSEPASSVASKDASAAFAGPQEGAGQVSSTEPSSAPSDRDTLLLADLIATGDARAESGAAALRHFLDELEAGERRLIPAATVEAWIKTAKAANAKGGR